jgi:phage baseplate assembly protein W
MATTASTKSNRQYKDIDLNFDAHPITGDVAKKVGDAAIISSMLNLLQTGKYERLMQPDIYSGVRRHLFEPIDNITSSALSNEIRNVIDKYEPRVSLTTVNVTPDYDSQGYSCTLTFFITNQTNPITVEFFLERIR